jgi:hypothetical protein
MNILTLENGKVELRKENGSLVRTIVSSHAVGCKWNGENIAVNTDKGKTEIRKENGSLIRTI